MIELILLGAVVFGLSKKDAAQQQGGTMQANYGMTQPSISNGGTSPEQGLNYQTGQYIPPKTDGGTRYQPLPLELM